MHVCHVNFASGFSGGERQTANLIKSLANMGWQQTLIVRPGSRLSQELKGVPQLAHITYEHFLLGHIRRGAPWDLVHCHDGRAVYWGWLEWVFRKTPYIITRRVDNRIGKSRVTGSAYSNASRVICLSSEIERRVLETVPSAKTEIIPSSFSELAFSQDRVTEIRDGYRGKFLVGQVGRLLEHKGYHITIEAARRLSVSHPEVQFVFVGEGPYEAHLKGLAENLTNVEFVGYKDDVGNWLAGLDLFVFPSLSEGLGSTILDAMQFDVPVIGAEAGGIPDLIDNEVSGLLVEPGNATALADAIAELVSDPDRRLKIAKDAKADLKRFDPEVISRKYESVYSSICAG